MMSKLLCENLQFLSCVELELQLGCDSPGGHAGPQQSANLKAKYNTAEWDYSSPVHPYVMWVQRMWFILVGCFVLGLICVL